MADTLEVLMLVSFGFSWPLSVAKNIRSRTAKSMSLPFIVLIILGYVAGIGAKIIQGKINYVLIVYLLNLTIVTVNLFVYFRNVHLDRKLSVKTDGEKAIKMPLFPTEICEKSAEKAKEFEMKNSHLKDGGVVFFGDDYLLELSPEELSAAYGVGCPVYNRCVYGLTMDDACRLAEKMVIGLRPSKLFICLNKRKNENGEAFVAKYEWLLYSLSLKTNSKLYIVLAPDNNADKETAECIRKMAELHGCPCITLTAYGAIHPDSALVFHQLMPYIRSGNISFADAMGV